MTDASLDADARYQAAGAGFHDTLQKFIAAFRAQKAELETLRAKNAQLDVEKHGIADYFDARKAELEAEFSAPDPQ